MVSSPARPVESASAETTVTAKFPIVIAFPESEPLTDDLLERISPLE